MSDKFHGNVKAGKTSVSLPVLLLKSADSTELTGIAYTSVTASYWRQGSTRTAITAATLGSVNAAFSSGGWVEIDATNMPGMYRLDVPDAAFATGADWVIVTVKVASAFVYQERIGLESAGSSEVMGVLPAAGTGVNSAGGLPTVGTGAGQLNPDGTGAVPIAFGTAQPASPAANTVGMAISYLNGKVGRTGTAQGGAANTIMLDTGASATDNSYKDHSVKLTGGTGAGQFATITGYVGSTKVATIWRPSAGNTWTTTPDGTTTFLIELVPAVDLQPAQSFNNAGQTTKAPVTLAGSDMTGNPPADWLTAVGIKADAVAKIQQGLSTYAGADTGGTTTLLGRLTGTRATNLDNLDAAVSSRMATFAYTAPDNTDIVAGLADIISVQTSVGSGLHTLVAALPAMLPAVDGSGRVSINLAQTGLAPRALDAVADASLTVGDALVAAVCGAAGKEGVSGTSYLVKTPSTGTVIRTFVLDSGTAPTVRS